MVPTASGGAPTEGSSPSLGKRRRRPISPEAAAKRDARARKLGEASTAWKRAQQTGGR